MRQRKKKYDESVKFHNSANKLRFCVKLTMQTYIFSDKDLSAMNWHECCVIQSIAFFVQFQVLYSFH